MWFDLGRSEGFPSQYPPNLTSVTVDVLEAGFIAAFIILIIAFYVSLPSTNLKNTVMSFCRVTLILLIGVLLLLCNFGQEWETSEIKTKTPYKAGTAQEIHAKIGVKIGLRSVNITLKAIPKANTSLEGERIDYNERFTWTWQQGRFGFGPYAGHLQQEFRAAQYRGLPSPILWVAEYFVIDGEGFRFGRFYRTAGWYCHILLWTAFACWLMSIVFFKLVIVYGAYTIGICGGLQILANIIWLVVKNPNPLVIPFEDETIRTNYGVTFWLTCFNGLMCLGISAGILIVDNYFDDLLYPFFNIDPLTNFDEVIYMTAEERSLLRPKKKTMHNDLPLIEMPDQEEAEETAEYIPVYMKRRKTMNVFRGSRATSTTAVTPSPGPAPIVSRRNKPKHLMPIA